jgi:hypothetical protein
MATVIVQEYSKMKNIRTVNFDKAKSPPASPSS